MIDFIYVRGGDKKAPIIAQKAGAKYGIRHDYTPYDDVFMLDIRFKKYIWENYLLRARDLRPTYAMVADYEAPSQRNMLYQQIDDIAPYCKRIMICPKFDHALADIPVDDSFIIAISVPTSYSGFIPDLSQLKNRKCHLLGGRPERQAELAIKIAGMGGEVLSADGNYLSVAAAYGRYFDSGIWKQANTRAIDTVELELFSLKSIVTWLKGINVSQPSLFEANQCDTST